MQPRILILSLLFPALAVQANPVDPSVIAGSVDFPEEFTDLLEITQHSEKAIIHWEGFSIGKDELTRFLQPGVDAAVLNRVTSGDASSILGGLEANGKVLLINPNGILFGADARVDTQGFLASTLDLPDAEFLAGGDMTLSGASQAPVVNLGKITAADGDVFLVGATVQNQGKISAPNGTVGLAAGQQVLITAEGDERVFVKTGSEGAIQQDGVIRAVQAELKAAGGNPKAMAVSVGGTVEATSVQQRGGRILLSGGGGTTRVQPGARVSSDTAVQIQSQNVEVGSAARVTAGGDEGGSILVDASDTADLNGELRARGEIGNGGLVQVNADMVQMSETAVLDASGVAAGGQVLVTGITSVDSAGSIKARALEGPGGILQVNAPDVSLRAPGVLDATGTSGGQIHVTAAQGLENGGETKARGTEGDGGLVILKGDEINLLAGSRIDASGERDGGQVFVEGASKVTSSGEIRARGTTGDGGFILVSADDVNVTGSNVLSTNGARNGGFIHVEGRDSATVEGRLEARGESGDGGAIHVEGDVIHIGELATIDASGARNGGSITVEGGREATISGTLLVVGEDGEGGIIIASADQLLLDSSALLDASGTLGGGEILAGGEYQGKVGRVSRNAQKTTVQEGAVLSADSQIGGDAGRIIVWADQDTLFHGTASTAAHGASGDGGFIEVSGKNRLGFDGTVRLQSAHGERGQLLLDPDITFVDFESASEANDNEVNDGEVDLLDGGLGPVGMPTEFFISGQAFLNALAAGPVTLQGARQVVLRSFTTIILPPESEINLISGGRVDVSPLRMFRGTLNITAGEAVRLARIQLDGGDDTQIIMGGPIQAGDGQNGGTLNIDAPVTNAFSIDLSGQGAERNSDENRAGGKGGDGGILSLTGILNVERLAITGGRGSNGSPPGMGGSGGHVYVNGHQIDPAVGSPAINATSFFLFEDGRTGLDLGFDSSGGSGNGNGNPGPEGMGEPFIGPRLPGGDVLPPEMMVVMNREPEPFMPGTETIEDDPPFVPQVIADPIENNDEYNWEEDPFWNEPEGSPFAAALKLLHLHQKWQQAQDEGEDVLQDGGLDDQFRNAYHNFLIDYPGIAPPVDAPPSNSSEAAVGAGTDDGWTSETQTLPGENWHVMGNGNILDHGEGGTGDWREEPWVTRVPLGEDTGSFPVSEYEGRGNGPSGSQPRPYDATLQEMARLQRLIDRYRDLIVGNGKVINQLNEVRRKRADAAIAVGEAGEAQAWKDIESTLLSLFGNAGRQASSLGDLLNPSEGDETTIVERGLESGLGQVGPLISVARALDNLTNGSTLADSAEELNDVINRAESANGELMEQQQQLVRQQDALHSSLPPGLREQYDPQTDVGVRNINNHSR